MLKRRISTGSSNGTIYGGPRQLVRRRTNGGFQMARTAGRGFQWGGPAGMAIALAAKAGAEQGKYDFKRIQQLTGRFQQKAGPIKRSTQGGNINKNTGVKSIFTKAKLTKRQKYKKKKWKKFVKKVDLATDKQKPRGHYTITRRVNLQQINNDKWNIQDNDQNGTGMELFTPKKIKDAEAILFNNKTGTQNSFNTTNWAVGPGTNFNAGVVTKIISLSANVYLKNVSQHHTIVEMYLWHGKSPTSINLLPDTQFANVQNNILNGNENDPVVYGSQFYHQTNLMKQWTYTKVVFDLVPGAECNHYIQGPKNMEWRGTNHIRAVGSTQAAPLWNNPEIKGNGIALMFRTINKPTLSVGGNVHRLPHAQAIPWGGIACEIKENYTMAPPTTTNIAGDYRTETNYIVNDLLGANPADQEINEQNPEVATGIQ